VLSTGVLWPYIEAVDAYRCPSDGQPWDLGPSHMITSYMMNGAVNGYGRKRRQYDIAEFDSDDILYWEAKEDNSGHCSFNDGSSHPWERMTRRHGEGATVGCMDGHAEWLTHGQYEAEVNGSPSRLWCNPGTADGRR
jgi:hypothetical protein